MASLPQFDAIPSPLSEEAFWRLFGCVEHERLDFKRGVPSDIRDAIPAMAMSPTRRWRMPPRTPTALRFQPPA